MNKRSEFCQICGDVAVKQVTARTIHNTINTLWVCEFCGRKKIFKEVKIK